MFSRRRVFAVACLGMLVFGITLTTLGAILPSVSASGSLFRQGTRMPCLIA